MKKIFVTTIAIAFAIQSFAQCTVELAAKLPYSCVKTNAFKYIGTNGKENKENTEVLYNKMVKIYELFDSAFKHNSGMVGKWRAQVDDKSIDGLVKGVIEIGLQPVTCKDNGEFIKSTGNPTVNIYVYINSFVSNLVKDKRKQPDFILDKDKADSLNGQTVYYICKERESQKFNGFPLYYYNWDSWKHACVIITRDTVPLFKPISVGSFLDLFKKWTSSYNAGKRLDPRYTVSPGSIDKFTASCTKKFLDTAMISIGEGKEQIAYLRKTSYTNDVTKGKQWVTINPDYINKKLPEISIQFLSIQFEGNTKDADPLTDKMIKDFRANFDFKKLQAMLEK
ncbi:MAG: hypothetical protein ABIP35_07935 [Ginsengibacter sp.]